MNGCDRTKSGYTSRYVPRDQVEQEQQRLQEMREAAESEAKKEIKDLEGEQHG